ncbi:MAG: hypothetical protein JST93_02965 [Acidobacteria bacterium]|nr:hypothetical protein [Acidobacteriota bacterium]
MSSFLIPLADALTQLPSAELTQPTAAVPVSFGAGASFDQLFPQVLAELAVSLENVLASPAPETNSSPAQTEFPPTEAGGRLCQPTALLERATSEGTAERLDPPVAMPSPAGASLLHSPVPIWTSSLFTVLPGAGQSEMEANREEPARHEETKAETNSSAEYRGMFVVVQLALPVPIEERPAAAGLPTPPVMIDSAAFDTPKEAQVDLPVQNEVLPKEKGIRTEDAVPPDQTVSELFPAPVPPLALPPVAAPTPAPFSSLPAPSSIPSSPDLQGVALQPSERRQSVFRQEDALQMGLKSDSQAPSEHREPTAAPEAFRLLLRNQSGNSAASETVPALRDLPQVDPPPTAMPPPVSHPAAMLKQPEVVAEMPHPAESVRPVTTGRPAQTATGKIPASATKLPEVTPDKPNATLAEPAGSSNEPQARIATDTGRHQGDHSSQRREDEHPAGSPTKPESAAKTAVLPARDVEAVRVEARHVSPQSESRVEVAAQQPSAVEDPAPLIPSSRTVQQLRVTLPPSAEGRNVEVLLNQRAGGVEVSVRSSDPQVRETLRSGLSDLVGSFDRKGVAVETLPLTVSGHLPQAGQSHVLTEAGAGKGLSTQVVAETNEGELPNDQQQQQRQAQWEPEGDNRRRRDQPAEAWQKYMEEYAWRSL